MEPRRESAPSDGMRQRSRLGSRSAQQPCIAPLLCQPAQRSSPRCACRARPAWQGLVSHTLLSPFCSGSGLPLPRAGAAVTFCVPPGLGAPKPATGAAAAVSAGVHRWSGRQRKQELARERSVHTRYNAGWAGARARHMSSPAAPAHQRSRPSCHPQHARPPHPCTRMGQQAGQLGAASRARAWALPPAATDARLLAATQAWSAHCACRCHNRRPGVPPSRQAAPGEAGGLGLGAPAACQARATQVRGAGQLLHGDRKFPCDRGAPRAARCLASPGWVGQAAALAPLRAGARLVLRWVQCPPFGCREGPRLAARPLTRRIEAGGQQAQQLTLKPN